jgi:tight adherence protein B
MSLVETPWIPPRTPPSQQDNRDAQIRVSEPSPPVEVVEVVEVAEWCEAVAQRVRAGDTLAHALFDVSCGPGIDHALRGLRLRISRGTDLVRACTLVIDDPNLQVDSPGVRALREALGVVRVCALGSPHTAHTLDRIARHFRVRVALAEEVRSHTASARLSARLLTALPIAAVGLTLVISPSAASVYTTSAGLVCLGLSLVLNVAGWLWIRSLIAAAAP